MPLTVNMWGHGGVITDSLDMYQCISKIALLVSGPFFTAFKFEVGSNQVDAGVCFGQKQGTIGFAFVVKVPLVDDLLITRAVGSGTYPFSQRHQNVSIVRGELPILFAHPNTLACECSTSEISTYPAPGHA